MDYPKRKPTRIPGYDYSQANYYFITICTHRKEWLFGDRRGLNRWGLEVRKQMAEIDRHYSDIRIVKSVVMPNHVHMIVAVGCDLQRAERTNLSSVIGLFKAGVSRTIHQQDPNRIVWQRSFHDHGIRCREDFENAWQYIETNPVKWGLK